MEGLAMQLVGIFYGHLVYFKIIYVFIWYILVSSTKTSLATLLIRLDLIVQRAVDYRGEFFN
jgi:hypothetical protein